MSKHIAYELLKIKAVFLSPKNPFTWASGIKSPIYCDNRLTLSYPDSRKKIEKALAKLVKETYPDVEMIIGTATAGIAHAAIIADYLNLPMGYVRSSKKDHGRQNNIEGKSPKGLNVVVIEDLISTAGSVINVVLSLKEAGANVLGIASLFTYELEKGFQCLNEHNLKNVSLSNFKELIEVALEHNYINELEANQCLEFQKNPMASDWMAL